nr:ribbon-helix-helix protein, CopG family [uncultured Halomonas sp.]
MATTKTATVTFRIDPGVKEALRTAAAREHRSIANMIEVLIRDYCQKNGVVVPGSDANIERTDGK